MIFDNLDEKLDSILIKENKYDLVQEFEAIFAESSNWSGDKNEQNLKFIKRVSHLEKELKLMPFFIGSSRYYLEFENFYIFYEDDKRRKNEIHIHYLFKSKLTDNIEIKVTFSSLESYKPFVTIKSLVDSFFFKYKIEEDKVFLKNLEIAPDYYKYALTHFLDENINDYLFLNYDFNKPELIVALRRIDKILNK